MSDPKGELPTYAEWKRFDATVTKRIRELEAERDRLLQQRNIASMQARRVEKENVDLEAEVAEQKLHHGKQRERIMELEAEVAELEAERDELRKDLPRLEVGYAGFRDGKVEFTFRDENHSVTCECELPQDVIAELNMFMPICVYERASMRQ